MTRRKSRRVEEDSEHQLALQLAELTEKERQLQQLPEQILREKRESEMMLPPNPELEGRLKAKRHHEQIVTRGQVENAVREHDRSLILLILLVACTASLIWWAYQAML